MWIFGGGNVSSYVTVDPSGSLKGRSVLSKLKGFPQYSWEAQPVTELSDHFASSLAAVDLQTDAMVEAMNTSKFSFQPVLQENAVPTEFRNLPELLKTLPEFEQK